MIVFFLFMTLTLTDDQSEAQSPTTKADTEELWLQEYVSVASKLLEAVQTAPSSVTVFTAAEVKELGIVYLEDLLNFIPGFMSQRQISYGQATTIQVRGKPENGYLSKDVLVLLDGVRLNDAFTGGSSMINRYVALDNLKQVEIIRGPGSALYGSNAYLGVINIVTSPNQKFLSLTTGSFDAASITFSDYHFLGEWRTSYYLRAERDNGDHYWVDKDYYNRSGPTRDPRSAIELGGTISFRAFTLHLSSLTQKMPDHMAGIAIGGEEVNGNIQRQGIATAAYEWILTDKFILDVKGVYVRSEETMIWRWPNFYDNGRPRDFGAFLELYHAGIEINGRYQLRPNNLLSFGLSREFRGITDNAIIGSEGGDLIYYRGDRGMTKNAVQQVWAFFLQDQHHFHEDLKAVVGLRLDDYNDVGTTINPRAALIGRMPWPQGSLKLMYGHAFLAPSNSELHQMNTLASDGNPELKPEIIETFETAYTHATSKLNMTLTYYHSEIQNRIEFIPIEDSELGETSSTGSENEGRTTPINKGRLTLYGLELELGLNLGRGLKLRGAYSKQLQDKDEWSSDQNANLALNWTRSAWNANLSTLYRSEVEKSDFAQGSDLILNGKIGWSTNYAWHFELNLQNLTDQDTRSPDAPFSDDGVVVERRGREIHLSCTWRR